MFSFMMWLMFQVASTVMLYKWYQSRHPDDAAAMMMNLKRMFTK